MKFFGPPKRRRNKSAQRSNSNASSEGTDAEALSSSVSPTKSPKGTKGKKRPSSSSVFKSPKRIKPTENQSVSSNDNISQEHVEIITRRNTRSKSVIVTEATRRSLRISSDKKMPDESTTVVNKSAGNTKGNGQKSGEKSQELEDKNAKSKIKRNHGEDNKPKRISTKKRKRTDKDSTSTIEDTHNADEKNAASEGAEEPYDEARISSENLSSDSTQDRLSDRQFISHQVTLLKKPFELEECADLAVQGTKAQQKRHIPQDVVKKVLRRLNSNVEDELLKHLNRQAQVKLLKVINKARVEETLVESSGADEDTDNGTIQSLRSQLKEAQEKLGSLKALAKICTDLESNIQGIKSNPLAKEVERTNKLVYEIFKKFSTSKVEASSFENSKYSQVSGLSGTQEHARIVSKLFGI
ncbi:predicted protein [Nematostella vectensis]|uniref:Uncharacterized protein n=1 Tax=Nematostella vectensis TaxID=45351 RepID=A7RTS3_NEMVE|nr:predicted protein [Nematostella vectensis]|eukprot:XP_001637142.1 predicted protein [Nematostella vectensis]